MLCFDFFIPYPYSLRWRGSANWAIKTIMNQFNPFKPMFLVKHVLLKSLKPMMCSGKNLSDLDLWHRLSAWTTHPQPHIFSHNERVDSGPSMGAMAGASFHRDMTHRSLTEFHQFRILGISHRSTHSEETFTIYHLVMTFTVCHGKSPCLQ